MVVGIVGSEAAKFTPKGEALARRLIKQLLKMKKADTVCSGHCHLGGVDIFAEEIARELGLKTLIFPPKTKSWTFGYRPRNLQIARHSDEVYCFTVNKLPPEFKGMKFDMCYHCGTNQHVKSGGCWTVKQAHRRGKGGTVLTVRQ